jgi:hypothetical protein
MQYTPGGTRSNRRTKGPSLDDDDDDDDDDNDHDEDGGGDQTYRFRFLCNSKVLTSTILKASILQ